MLIIPIENKPNWRHPPIITIAIIALNVFIYAIFQTGDNEVQMRAVQKYMDSGLPAKESKELLVYLNENNSEFIQYIKPESDRYYAESIATIAYQSPEFDEWIHDFWRSNNIQDEAWRSERRLFEKIREETINHRFALTPKKHIWYTFITSTFLHGSWGHLVGNMVFLFLFGFLLELVLGRLIYLGLYLFTGVFSGGLFALLNLNSAIPLVGASGAISGLMGVYIVMYGARRIRFFYSLGFYFGEFRAPALAILPLWLAKEVYGATMVEDNVAYMAHFGGLASGAIAMFVLNQLNISQNEMHLETEEDQRPFKDAQKRIASMVSKLELDRAIKTSNIYLNEYPNKIELYEQQFDTIIMRPNHTDVHKNTFSLLRRIMVQINTFKKNDLKVSSNNLESQFQALFVEIVKKYKLLCEPAIIFIQGPTCAVIASFLFQSRQYALAVEILELGLKKLPLGSAFKKPLGFAMQYYRGKKELSLVKKYSDLYKAIN